MRHRKPGRDVGDAHRRIGGVHRLPARPRRAVDIDAQILVLDLDIDILGLGQHRDGRCGRVDAALGFSGRHALHPVHAGFELQMGKGSCAIDVGDHFLVAAMLALAGGDHLHLPALEGGIALVHAEQVAREDRRLVAAGSGADFEDHVALVGGILGQQQDADLVFQLFDLRFKGGLLFGSHLGHLAARRDHAAEVFQLAIALAQGRCGSRGGFEIGIFLRQLDEGIPRCARREVMLDGGKALDDAV